MKLLEIINGTLLGDASVKFDSCNYNRYSKKYFSYKLTAKDKKFLEWFRLIVQSFNISKTWITKENNTYSMYFYISNSPYPNFIKLREKWYLERPNKRAQKIIPKDLKLTPVTLLHWYLGDGCLVRRKNDKNRVPSVVLATNAFSKDDIDSLINKLKELGLSFYPVRYKSGFTGKWCGYCLYSRTQEGTPFRFFKVIGECPKEIEDCTTGNKGIYHEAKFFKDKWPTEDDWIKILSNVDGIGAILRERREEVGMSKKELTEKLSVNKDYMRKLESGKRFPSVEKLKQILNALDLNSPEIS